MALSNTYFETKGKDITFPIPIQPSYVPPDVPTPQTPTPGSVPSIPIPTFSGNVSCTLYVNESERNQLDKIITSKLSDTIVIKEEVDVLNPVVYIKTSTDITGVNYMKLDDRYYYAHVQLLPGGDIYKVTGETDPLMTFKDAIRNNTGLISRNQNFYNRFLNDERVKLNAYEQVKTLKFSSGFSKTMQYYLITIGGDD